jgi:hypothetical protein
MKNAMPVAVTVKIRDYNCTGEVNLASQWYAQIDVDHRRPATLTVEVHVEAPEAKKVFSVQHGIAGDLLGNRIFVFAVPVTWEGEVPHTREKGKDNADIIVVDDEGNFGDYQIAVITRRGSFFVTSQLVYEGRIVRTIGKKTTFVPTNPIFAFPGASYEAIWEPMAGEIAEIAKIEGTSKQLNRVRREIATWNPPTSTKVSGWISGTVAYYNMVTGTGRVIAEDKKSYFVHFKNILTKDGQPIQRGVPLLEPMTSVILRPDAKPKGPGPAVASVKPAPVI